MSMKIVFNQYVIAYLDLLGFKEFIEKAEKNPKERNELKKLLEVIPKHIQSEELSEKYPLKDLKIKCWSFSDSLIISAPVNKKIPPGYPTALISVSIKAIQIAHALLGIGFSVRGAISVGKAYRSESNIMGTGYQEAVTGEEKCAVYPRIMLTDSAKRHLDELLNKKMARFAIFSKDEDEKVILNSIYPSEYYVDEQSRPIEDCYSMYRKIIENNIKDPYLNSKARSKWLWLAKLFNSNVNYFPELKGIQPIIIIPKIVPNFLNPPENESNWFENSKASGFEVRINVPGKTKSEE